MAGIALGAGERQPPLAWALLVLSPALLAKGYHFAGAALVLPGIWLARSAPLVKEEPPIP